MAYVGVAVTFLALMFAMFKYFEGRMDKKFDRIELQLAELRADLNSLRSEFNELKGRVTGLELAIYSPADRLRKAAPRRA